MCICLWLCVCVCFCASTALAGFDCPTCVCSARVCVVLVLLASAGRLLKRRQAWRVGLFGLPGRA